MKKLSLHSLHARAGAVFREAQGYELPAHYGSAAGEALAASRDAVLADHSERGRLAVLGPDRIDFLHGQASNDVKVLAPGEGTYTAFLTGKGKMRGDARLYRLAEHVLLDTEAEARELLLAHLQGFVIMEDVTLEDWTERTVELGVHGPGARAALAKALGVDVPEDLPLHATVARSFEGTELTIAHERPTGAPGYVLLADAGSAPAVFLRLAESIPLAGHDALEIRRVEAGIPRFGAEMDEGTIPIEAGLVHAVSYTKGCYTGNEVILRLRTYGHVNRRVVALRIEGGVPVQRGDAVVASLEPAAAATGTADTAATGEGGGTGAPEGSDLARDAGGGAAPPTAPAEAGEKNVGNVTTAVVSPHAGAPLALAMVRREASEAGTRVTIIRAGSRVAAMVVTPPLDGRNG